MSERNFSSGYIALAPETTKGTIAATPSIYTPVYSQSLTTDIKMMSDEPAYGSKFKRFKNLPGIRAHGGSVQVMAEPNSAASWFKMLMQKGSTTGSGPYTHPYTHGNTNPISYTIDLSLVSHVVRFLGMEASKIGVGWREEEMVFDVDLSGLKSFNSREVSSVSGSGPYTITLKSNGQYDSPTTGLIVGDTIQIYDVSAGSYIDCVVDGLSTTTITVSEDVTAATSGDVLTIKPATPSLSVLTPFLWARTRYTFAVDASTALSNSATASNQTRLEPGTTLNIMHEFDNNEGSKRSGDFDPASLPRKRYDVELDSKVFLDSPDRFRDWSELTKSALVMRAFSGSSNQYELRITLNNLKAKNDDAPTESESVIYHEQKFSPEYDESDGQAFDVKIINNKASAAI